MEGTFQRRMLVLLYADDLVGIFITAGGPKCEIIDPWVQYACRHRYGANALNCGVIVCGPAALVQGLPARTYTWGQTESPMVLQYKHHGNTITPNKRPDMHIKQVIIQGNARVLQMGKLLLDQHLPVCVKRMLVQTALRPLHEYGAEVLVPTTQHARASESMQLKAARMILGCPSRPLSEVIRADLGLQLLRSCRENTKLKWQHRLHSLLAVRLEQVLYEVGLPAPAQA